MRLRLAMGTVPLGKGRDRGTGCPEDMGVAMMFKGLLAA